MDDSDDKASVISTLAKVKPEHYQTFVHTVDALSAGFHTHYKALVMIALATVKPEDYQAIIHTVDALSAGMNSRDKADTIITLAKVKPEHYQVFTSAVDVLSVGMHGDAKAVVIRALARAKREHYQTFVHTVDALSAGMNSRDKESVVITLAKVKPENYQVFTSAVDVLSAGMNHADKASVISIFAKVKPENYQVFTSAVDVLSAGMNNAEKIGIISAVSNPALKSEDYQTIIHIREALGIGLNAEQTIFIISRIAINPSALNAARALLFTRWMEERGGEGRQLTIQVLETWLDNPVPPLGAEFAPGVNPYEAGMNVHAAGRDQKTQEAFKLLLSLWTPSEGEVAQYSQAFIDYATSQNAADAVVANRVLLGIGRKTNDFGGLLQAKALLIQGEIISPSALLAHLWHFITIKVAEDISPAEVKTAQASIIGALNDSIETDDHVVCDPGKLQRLASILQGRLEGATIDPRLEIPADAKLVQVNPALLPQPADIQPMGAAAAAAPVHAGPQYIRDVNVIQNYMNELKGLWEAKHATAEEMLAEEMLQDTLGYLGELKTLDIYLDPRDVIFYLIFGTGQPYAGGAFQLNPPLGPLAHTQGMFRVDDYMAEYQDRERQAFDQAEAARRERSLAQVTASSSSASSAASAGSGVAATAARKRFEEIRADRIK